MRTIGGTISHPFLHPLIAWIIALAIISFAVFALVFFQRRCPSFSQLIACISGEDDRLAIVPSRRATIAWWIGGAIFLAAAFSFLETRHPFYFSQDDALVAELPGMIEGCRSVWAGVWPDYDPCRLMGGPLAGAGLFSLTYPPTYLCYAIARHGLRNENALLEVFAALHLAAGYWVMTRLCRRTGMRPMLACGATLSLLLSGSVLIMGRSWHAFLPIVVWMPLLMMAVERLCDGPVGWPWALGTGLAAGLLFHVGFPQIWIYAVLLTAAPLLWLVGFGAVSWRRLLRAWPAAVIALGVMMPLLLPQLSAARGLLRPPPYGTGITREWIAALLPYPLVRASHPMGWGSTDSQYMGHFVYFGSVFAIGFVLSVLAVLSRSSKCVWRKNVWLAGAIFAFLLTIGDRGVLFFFLSKLPLIRMVNNNPFRALPFFVLFAVVSTGIAVERLLRMNRKTAGKTPPWAAGFAVLTLALLGYHVIMARSSFYTYGFTPYPALAPSIAKRIEGIASGRVASWTTTRSISPLFAATLPLNLPMLYDVVAFSGYDPLLEFGPSELAAEQFVAKEPVEALCAYGVRWHLLSPLIHSPVLSPNTKVNQEEQIVKDHSAMKAVKPLLQIIAHTDGALLGELTGVSPMVFPEQHPTISIPLTANGNGIFVPLKRVKGGGIIVVNFLCYPQMRATVDGRAVKISHDKWQRIIAVVPPGGKSLHIAYVADWPEGLSIGAALCVLGLAGGWAGSRRDVRGGARPRGRAAGASKTFAHVDIDSPN